MSSLRHRQKALNYLQNGSLDLKSGMESLAIDEADLILSYGHDSDVKSLLGGNFLPATSNPSSCRQL